MTSGQRLVRDVYVSARTVWPSSALRVFWRTSLKSLGQAATPTLSRGVNYEESYECMCILPPSVWIAFLASFLPFQGTAADLRGLVLACSGSFNSLVTASLTCPRPWHHLPELGGANAGKKRADMDKACQVWGAQRANSR